MFTLGSFPLLILAVAIVYRLFHGHIWYPDDLLRDHHVCEQPTYTARILSHDPLMIHIENFITPFERQHLIETA